ncbi:MAG: hypothetical protein KDC90_00265 [Ignavibacteriae bacterium]|nr:hypothetical protein [Ignavibacteriota bacterium]
MNSKLPNVSNSLEYERVEKISLDLQEILEEIYYKSPAGGCYLIGHCLSEILNEYGLVSRKVTGKLALHIKNTNDKYAKYGIINLKGHYIGNYHTWCEVVINNETYIIDPSLKYNKLALKQYFDIKVNNKIPNLVFSKKANTYIYKYIEDISLECQSMSFLKRISTCRINEIVTKTLEKQNNEIRKAS